MISYATVTGTKRNIRALRDEGWGWLFSAAGWLPTHSWIRDQGIEENCGDSGAWHYHNNGLPFDEEKYRRFIPWILPLQPRFVMLPDIVAGGKRSLDLSMSWRAQLGDAGVPLALVVQDGIEIEDVAHLVGPDLAVCIGGTTEWKLAEMGRWCALANARGAWSHVLRVNTGRRIRACDRAGAKNYDGTSGSMYAETVPMLTRERRVQDIEGWLARNPA